MRTGTVFRQGRTRHVSQEERRCNKAFAHSCVFPTLAVFACLGLTANLYHVETFFQRQQLAFNEVEDQVRHLSSTSVGDTQYLSEGALVHFTNKYSSTVSDDDFAVDLSHGLKLQRMTQYCQWRETSDTKCQTCRRKDSEGKEETYECNCEQRYYYVKAWRSTRINSFLFDQPANHYNPQRDPYPSLTRFSTDVAAGSLSIAADVVTQLRAPVRALVFTHQARPITRSLLQLYLLDPIFGAPPPPRYETVRDGLAHFRRSPAASTANFVYTNHADGWFFSPYQASNFERALKGFGQFLEGSLMDWQLGDLYDFYNGCTAGDIRSRFLVADPGSVSVIGSISSSSRNGNRNVVKSYVAQSNGFRIGLMHAGMHSMEQMFINETKEAYWSCKLGRMLFLVAGFACAYLIKRFAPRGSPIISDMAATGKGFVLVAGGLNLCLVTAVWVLAYGLSDWDGVTVATGAAGAALLLVAFRNAAGNVQGKRL